MGCECQAAILQPNLALRLLYGSPLPKRALEHARISCSRFVESNVEQFLSSAFGFLVVVVSSPCLVIYRERVGAYSRLPLLDVCSIFWPHSNLFGIVRSVLLPLPSRNVQRECQ